MSFTFCVLTDNLTEKKYIIKYIEDLIDVTPEYSDDMANFYLENSFMVVGNLSGSNVDVDIASMKNYINFNKWKYFTYITVYPKGLAATIISNIGKKIKCGIDLDVGKILTPEEALEILD